MNLLYPNNPKERLTAILTEINTLLTGNCDKYDAEADSIYVATWNEIEQEYAAHASAIEGGFGYSTHKIERDGHKKLVIIHENNCTNAALNDDEIKAIILHELGHLLNFPQLEREPTPLDVYQKKATNDQIKATKETNLRMKEIYADAYAKQHGYLQESLEVFRKFNEWSGQPVGFSEERTGALNDDNNYLGTVRPVNRNGF